MGADDDVAVAAHAPVSPSRRKALFTLASLHVILCSGTAYGWTAIRPVLKNAGIFASSSVLEQSRKVGDKTTLKGAGLRRHARRDSARNACHDDLPSHQQREFELVFPRPKRAQLAQGVVHNTVNKLVHARLFDASSTTGKKRKEKRLIRGGSAVFVFSCFLSNPPPW